MEINQGDQVAIDIVEKIISEVIEEFNRSGYAAYSDPEAMAEVTEIHVLGKYGLGYCDLLTRHIHGRVCSIIFEDNSHEV